MKIWDNNGWKTESTLTFRYGIKPDGLNADPTCCRVSNRLGIHLYFFLLGRSVVLCIVVVQSERWCIVASHGGRPVGCGLLAPTSVPVCTAASVLCRHVRSYCRHCNGCLRFMKDARRCSSMLNVAFVNFNLMHACGPTS